jgi:hypothetical protein
MNCEICGRPLPDGARFCPNCGAAVGPLVGALVDLIHDRPGFVVKVGPSAALTDRRWTNTTILSSEVAAAVRELKAKPGRG